MRMVSPRLMLPEPSSVSFYIFGQSMLANLLTQNSPPRSSPFLAPRVFAIVLSHVSCLVDASAEIRPPLLEPNVCCRHGCQDRPCPARVSVMVSWKRGGRLGNVDFSRYHVFSFARNPIPTCLDRAVLGWVASARQIPENTRSNSPRL